MVKNQLANTGDLDLTSGWGRSPGGGNGNSLQYSCPGKSHRQRSLASYSPWGCKQSDMTEAIEHKHKILFDGKKKFFKVQNADLGY